MSNAVLAIETSTPRGSIAIMTGNGEVVFVEAFESDRSHNSLLFAPLERALAMDQAFDSIIVGTGPGSYTGVRIGISAAIGISLAKDISIAGVSSLCALEAAPGDGCYMVAGDARRGSFYCVEVKRWQLVGEPEICSRSELIARLDGTGLPLFSCDSAPLPCAAEVTFPDAGRLALASQKQKNLDFSTPVEPIYLRTPYITTPKTRGRPAK